MGAEAGVPFFCVQIEVPAEAVDSVREFILMVRDAFNEVVKELTVILRIVVDVEDVDGLGLIEDVAADDVDGTDEVIEVALDVADKD